MIRSESETMISLLKQLATQLETSLEAYYLCSQNILNDDAEKLVIENKAGLGDLAKTYPYMSCGETANMLCNVFLDTEKGIYVYEKEKGVGVEGIIKSYQEEDPFSKDHIIRISCDTHA